MAVLLRIGNGSFLSASGLPVLHCGMRTRRDNPICGVNARIFAP